MEQMIGNSDPEAVYRLYKDMVFRMAFTYVKNIEDAKDITQEVFLKLFSKKLKLKSEEHRKRWLLCVTANLAKDYLKSFYVMKRREYLEGEITEIPAGSILQEDSDIWDDVFSLPPKNRVVIYLHYYEGYTYEEIADILRLRLSAVKMRARRGIEKLRLEMDIGSGQISGYGENKCIREKISERVQG